MQEVKNTTEGENKRKQVPIREGYFHQATDFSDESYLIGGKCSVCGYVSFPKRAVCPACIKENTMEEMRLSRRGKIYSYSVLHIPLPAFPAPYILARIELPEGPIVLSLVTDCEPVEGALEIGDEVELVIGKIFEDNEGNDTIGYMFRPLQNRDKNEAKE